MKYSTKMVPKILNREKILRQKKLCSNLHTIQNNKTLISQVTNDYNNFSVWSTDHGIVHSQSIPEDHYVKQILQYSPDFTTYIGPNN